MAGDVVLVIHGGAGVAPRAELSRQKEAAVRAELEVALRAGFGVLSKGGSAVDAVSACVVLLEDSPLFNAGRGAALNALGQAELDASIMEGHTLRAGGGRRTAPREKSGPARARRDGAVSARDAGW